VSRARSRLTTVAEFASSTRRSPPSTVSACDRTTPRSIFVRSFERDAAGRDRRGDLLPLTRLPRGGSGWHHAPRRPSQAVCSQDRSRYAVRAWLAREGACIDMPMLEIVYSRSEPLPLERRRAFACRAAAILQSALGTPPGRLRLAFYRLDPDDSTGLLGEKTSDAMPAEQNPVTG